MPQRRLGPSLGGQEAGPSLSSKVPPKHDAGKLESCDEEVRRFVCPTLFFNTMY